jgi:hypothetical protein
MSDEDREAKERKNMMRYGMLEDDVNPMLTETKLWISEDAVSQWAYYQCLKLRDNEKKINPELKDMITTSKWAYMYCQHIGDDFDMRQKIVESEWALNYCTQIRDDNEVLERIKDPVDALLYFEYKKDRLESHVQIYSSTDQRKRADEAVSSKKSKQEVLDESCLPEFIEVKEGSKKTLKKIKDVISKIRGRKH